ncbi:malonyl-CoA O-methyltransferase [Kushneria sinocarnis]|uniref:Malonyl-[acyl-carrier protein] O-methyltransferase n=1 Tax=Kushneria sinocarnis TaxID=595502 RepID=A0A420X1G0_9GAMM|nr:malonyl-ACP O-methyltransferase BioC [Kushneria sinocarnis]RKR07681.1 malonyl-CoA O-methyltransferase [Kushneria sinocarnis]
MIPETDPVTAHDVPQQASACFSRAAGHYDEAAALQREVADRLLAHIDDARVPATIVDVGCGTGYVTAQLQQRFPGAALIGVDPAPGMLSVARSRHAALPIDWRAGAAEALPLPAESTDLLVSSLALQWCASPAPFLAEAERVLRPGGRLCFTTLCEGSLFELKDAWQTLDNAPHVNAFITPEALHGELQASALHYEEMTLDDHRTFHPDPATLMRALKAVGANTVAGRGVSGLTGRARFARLERAIEAFRTDAGLPTTYRVARVNLHRPADSAAGAPAPPAGESAS